MSLLMPAPCTTDHVHASPDPTNSGFDANGGTPESGTQENGAQENGAQDSGAQEKGAQENSAQDSGAQENVTYRTGFLKRPEHTEPVIHAGYSVLCEIEGRPDVLLKVPLPFEEYGKAIEIEKRVYSRLGKHPNIVNVLEMDEWGIYPERAEPGSFRCYYKNGGKATPEERIRWCCDLARVLDYVHQHNVRHADLSPKNLLLHGRNILLCDFGGSSVDDARAVVIGEAGFRHFDRNEYLEPTMRSEIHSLGSTIYEIITGKKPYRNTEDQDNEIDNLMSQGRYPDVKTLPLGDVITKCWNGTFDSALRVAEEISSSTSRYLAQEWPSLACHSASER